MYYDWVHEDFMRGETFLQRDENDQFVYPDGIGFDNPFRKGSRRKPLPDETRFPLPQGPRWEARLFQHSTRSNDHNIAHYNARMEKQMMNTAAAQAVYDTKKFIRLSHVPQESTAHFRSLV